ncbi:hypothetical protein MKW92_048038 [Papaver armeniacum]|nr:hypothetical protein MKW92_048038 [Papaver armeniacum]
MAKAIPFATLIIFFLVSTAFAQYQTGRQSQQQQIQQQEARQCRIQRITSSQPTQRIQSEGGVTEMWNEFEDQFQCAGVAALRNIIQPNCLSLPNFSPSPRLECPSRMPETYHSGQQSVRGGGARTRQGEQRDQHQKVHRVRQGDIVALPAGVAHWCYNDGNEELVAVSVNDLNNNANQLEQKLRSFYLAGGHQQIYSSVQSAQQQQQQRETFQNVFRSFDENLMAEAFNLPVEAIRRMQQEDQRGFIVRVAGEGMRMIRPEEEEEYEEILGRPKEADIYSKQGGRINHANGQKLQILNYMDMSAEKGNLYPNAMHAPHWTMNAHSVFYVTRGHAHVEIVGSNGQRVYYDTVNQGELFVVPQQFVSTIRAGSDGFEYVAFKTSSQPMKSPLVGYTSALKAMPIQDLSTQEAQKLKYNREHQTMLFPFRSVRSS